MGEIFLDYGQIYDQTSSLYRHVFGDLQPRTDNDYSQLNQLLSLLSGSTISAMTENVDLNRLKSLMALSTLNKLILFMSSSTKEFELNEIMMSHGFQI
ncbi:MAG: hypothetical protein LBC96_09745 [Lachnospiraceae bacterium]|nr:hypothetical protein [Lachnospiraceae bacterium]